MSGKITQRTQRTEFDPNTGEIIRNITDEKTVGFVQSEPEYVKIYTGTQLCLLNLNPNLAPVIIAFSRFMTYANDETYPQMVACNELTKQGVADTLGVSTKRVDQLLKELVEAGIFIPIVREIEKDGVITRKKKRGMYFVSPWVVGKGSWHDIKKLQQSIDYTKGVTCYTINDELGSRKVNMSLPAPKEEPKKKALPSDSIAGQMVLKEDGTWEEE